MTISSEQPYPYPEHARLSANKDKFEAVEDFLEFITIALGYLIVKDRSNGLLESMDYPGDLALEWLGIDKEKLKEERRQIVKDMKSQGIVANES